ncbi:hypothetical protein [Bradyrhizobium lablabi]|uniref:hypothetical protein n=1 Tax=Bradyrhizobium lablabi TaxID=722472 RepID=UPI001BA687A4|nr:hypothetical protein [Bradyrhizobium lablabi]MBR0693643.1 hypothetical protein [Bradyrhizobium lablabi]
MYIDALKGRAIYVHAAPGGKISRIGFEPQRNFELAHIFWFAKPSHAELIVMRCCADFEAVGAMQPANVAAGGWIDMRPIDVHEKIKIVADQLGARWRNEAQLKREAENVVAEIIARVESMRRTGRLAEINAKYKAYRLAKVAKGEKAIGYPAYMSRYTQHLVARAAEAAHA